MRKLYYLLAINLLLLINQSLEAKKLNGIEIPNFFEEKIIEYRSNFHHDNCLSSIDKCDYSVNELNNFLKENIKFDSTYYCKICGIFFPISSSFFANKVSNDDLLCLDGFPQNTGFILPPECPYCGCIYPQIELDSEKEEIYKDLSNRARFDMINSEIRNPCERYILMLDKIFDISYYEKSKIYFKYAHSPNAIEKTDSLKKSLLHFDTFLKNNNISFKATDIDNFNYNFAFYKIDLLRQTCDFEKASELINLIEKTISNQSYLAILIELEKTLILKKNSNRAFRPFGNEVHQAIHQRIDLNKLQLPPEKIIEQSKAYNMNGNNAFVQAIYEKNLNAIKFLGKLNKDFLTEKDSYGNTALHVAAKTCDAKILSALIKLGCNLEDKNILNQTPVFLAARYNNLSALNVLLKSGAKTVLHDINNKSLIEVANNDKTKQLIAKYVNIH